MSPVLQADLPSRSKSSASPSLLRVRMAKEDRQESSSAVKAWRILHDAPADSNSKKILRLQTVCLKSQLYGQAKPLCSGISEIGLTEGDAFDLIAGIAYQRDAPSVDSEAFCASKQLRNSRRTKKETWLKFESSFSAQAAQFNLISNTTDLIECITDPPLLSIFAAYGPQRAFPTAAAEPSDENSNSQLWNDEFLSYIKQHSVSSVIKQCHKVKFSSATSDH